MGWLLAFAWVRNYGPGVLGGSDIYLWISHHDRSYMDHDGGENEFPSGLRTGGILFFPANRTGNEQIGAAWPEARIAATDAPGPAIAAQWSFK